MEPVTLVIKKSTGQVAFVHKGGGVSQEAPEGARVLVDRKNPFIFEATGAGAEVTRLGDEFLIPDGRLNGMVCGSLESYRAKIGQ